jgi:hypothetical protein
MNERLVAINLPAVYPGASAALGADYAVFTAPCDLVLVYVTAAPSVNDAGLTLDIEDDGTAIVDDLACATAATPGTWKSTHVGGTNTPVRIAAGSKISLTAANAANGTSIVGQMWCLTGEVFA